MWNTRRTRSYPIEPQILVSVLPPIAEEPREIEGELQVPPSVTLESVGGTFGETLPLMTQEVVGGLAGDIPLGTSSRPQLVPMMGITPHVDKSKVLGGQSEEQTSAVYPMWVASPMEPIQRSRATTLSMLQQPAPYMQGSTLGGGTTIPLMENIYITAGLSMIGSILVQSNNSRIGQMKLEMVEKYIGN